MNNPQPKHPVPGLTEITTLSKLAAESKFASSDLDMPDNHLLYDYEFFLDGEKQDVMLIEIYAPGDSTGWALVWEEVAPGKRDTKLVRGKWTMTRKLRE